MGLIKAYSKEKDGTLRLSKYFSVREFACNDGSDRILIDEYLVELLTRIREHFGKSVYIASGYKSESCVEQDDFENIHTAGKAADIYISGISGDVLAEYAESIGVKGIILYQGNNFVHVDTRTDFYYAEVTEGKPFSVETFGTALPAYRAPEGTVTFGYHGEGGKYIQWWLNRKGFDCGEIDGIIGPVTLTAIMDFQLQNGLDEDGAVGPLTLAKLVNQG